MKSYNSSDNTNINKVHVYIAEEIFFHCEKDCFSSEVDLQTSTMIITLDNILYTLQKQFSPGST